MLLERRYGTRDRNPAIVDWVFPEIRACLTAGPDHPVADLTKERINRRPVLGGLLNKHEQAA